MLPILVVLFIFSYAILAMLVWEQGQTIESQRSLIREMLQDSTQLAALKGKIAREESLRSQQKAATSSKPQKDAIADPKAPGKENTRSGKPSRSLRQTPGKPASDLEDVRRSTRVI